MTTVIHSGLFKRIVAAQVPPRNDLVPKYLLAETQFRVTADWTTQLFDYNDGSSLIDMVGDTIYCGDHLVGNNTLDFVRPYITDERQWRLRGTYTAEGAWAGDPDESKWTPGTLAVETAGRMHGNSLPVTAPSIDEEHLDMMAGAFFDDIYAFDDLINYTTPLPAGTWIGFEPFSGGDQNGPFIDPAPAGFEQFRTGPCPLRRFEVEIDGTPQNFRTPLGFPTEVKYIGVPFETFDSSLVEVWRCTFSAAGTFTYKDQTYTVIGYRPIRFADYYEINIVLQMDEATP